MGDSVLVELWPGVYGPMKVSEMRLVKPEVLGIDVSGADPLPSDGPGAAGGPVPLRRRPPVAVTMRKARRKERHG